MEKYCEIKNINYNKKTSKYLLSASLFLLSNSYKSAERYVNGLKKIYEFIKVNPEYTLRLYYDNSIYKDPNYNFVINKLLKDKERIELVKFKCTPFITKFNVHRGTFGTLIRFLPIFEKSDYKIVYIIDIDDKSYDYIKLYFKKLEKDSVNIYAYILNDYGHRYNYEFDNKFDNVALANIFVKDYKFDLKIFIDFLESLITSDKLFEKIRQINKKVFKSKIREDIVDTYGIDEYFLNIILINRLKSNQIAFLKENYDISYFLENLIIYDSKPQTLIEEYLKDIIKQFYPVIKYQNKNVHELKKILYESMNIYSKEIYSKLFIENYFKTVNHFKEITIKYYYGNSFYIFNEAYIDDLLENDFDGINWYLKKNWDYLPDNIKNNVKI